MGYSLLGPIIAVTGVAAGLNRASNEPFDIGENIEQPVLRTGIGRKVLSEAKEGSRLV